MDENPYTSNFVEPPEVRLARSQRLRFGACVIGGVGVTPVLLLISVYSFGGGHGDYFAARASFPIPMLLTRFFDGSISLPIIVLAICQYPAVGCALGFASVRGWRCLLWTSAVLIGIHVTATMLAFSGFLPNFS